ncbi:Reverse transcriptase zinc-binding domain [Sesbania bispinosa]|nr:Reverse transcriptase zinc-binding domain [Sesbania bispinosa]
MSGTILRDVCLCPYQDIWSTLPVSSFSESAHGWKLDGLRDVLPLEAVEEINAHMCPCEDLGPDSVIWGGTSNGAFSTKSAYTIINNPAPGLPDPIWNLIWRWEGPERAKCLLWVILHKGLKTRSKGFNGGFMDSNLCPLCMNYEETSLHILRDCCHTRGVWVALSNGVLPGNFSHQNLSYWISSNLNCAAGQDWNVLFGIAVWLIWQGRNAWVFEGVNFNSTNIAHRIFAYAQIGSAAQTLPVRNPPSYREELIRWNFPDPSKRNPKREKGRRKRGETGARWRSESCGQRGGRRRWLLATVDGLGGARWGLDARRARGGGEAAQLTGGCGTTTTDEEDQRRHNRERLDRSEQRQSLRSPATSGNEFIWEKKKGQ